MLNGYRCFTVACFLHHQGHCSPRRLLLGSIDRTSYRISRQS